MPVLRCLARYRSRKGAFEAGQEFEVSDEQARFFLADAPGSFEVKVGSAKGVSVPAVDKMVKAPDKAKSEEVVTSPASSKQAVTDPGAFTVGELKGLDLKVEEWKLMLRAERRDKNRATAVTLIEEKIREIEA